MEKIKSNHIVSTMNQDQIEKYIEELFDSLKPMDKKNKDIIKQSKNDIKSEIKQTNDIVKVTKHEN